MHALSQRAADLEAELEYGVHEGDKCTLLSGSFDAIVQVVLAMGAFGSLLVKRHLETPKRTLQVRARSQSARRGSPDTAVFCSSPCTRSAPRLDARTAVRRAAARRHGRGDMGAGAASCETCHPLF